MNFPIIKQLSDLQSMVQKDEIRFALQSNGHTVGCYLFAGADTFDTPWAEECRGISFDEHGVISGRPLHKFYNLGERPGSLPADFDWRQIEHVYDKRDGSMITTVGGVDGILLKSKKSFTSDVALAASAWLDQQPKYKEFCEFLHNVYCAGPHTAIFEWTSPDARIVLAYDKPELQLLHVRKLDTGEYLKHYTVRALAELYQVKMAEDTDSSRELNAMLMNGQDITARLHELVETLEGVEGWVFKFNDGRMVKVKTQWYLRLHRMMTFLRERDIAGLVINEQLDDVKSQLVQEGIDITQVLAIEKRVNDELSAIYHVLSDVGAKLTGMTSKDAALFLGAQGGRHQYFSLLMAQHRGIDPDVKDWFIKHRLMTYSLTQLVMKGDDEITCRHLIGRLLHVRDWIMNIWTRFHGTANRFLIRMKYWFTR
jgi:RNA ligase